MLKLEDLIPEGSEFKLRITGKTYKLRPFSMQDELWIQKTFGDGIHDIFKKLKMQEICRITFHQLEDKSEFTKREVKFVNEEGDSTVQTLGGVELLFSLISGTDEKIEIVNALLATIGLSRPVVQKLEEADRLEKEKKSLATETTGQ